MRIHRLQQLFFGGIVGMAILIFGGIVFALVAGCGSTKEVAQPAVHYEPPTEYVGAATTTSPFTTTMDEGPSWRWGPVFFYTSQHNIRYDQIPALNEQAEFLMDNPDLYVHVTGHADRRGSRITNALLASRRAAAVRDYLVRSGVNEEQIITLSFGADKTTGAGLKADRRAEVVVQ
jgi:hypothetical protein